MILVLNCGSQSIKWKVFDASSKAIKEASVKVLTGDDYKKIWEISNGEYRGG